jgi:hypothetical protein
MPVTGYTPATDPFGGRREYTGPVFNGFAVTPSDSVQLKMVARRIYVGGAGNLTVLLRGDSHPVTLFNVPAGSYHDLGAVLVMATGTTATDIVAFV